MVGPQPDGNEERSISAINELLEKLLEANDRLAIWHQAIDLEWERLKREHNTRAGNPYGFTAHIEEISTQALAIQEFLMQYHQ